MSIFSIALFAFFILLVVKLSKQETLTWTEVTSPLWGCALFIFGFAFFAVLIIVILSLLCVI